MIKLLSAITSLVVSVAALNAEPVTYTIDPAHSRVGFEVKHFFTPVSGNFNSFEGTIIYDEENEENSSVKVSIDVSSINTNNSQRDDHLRTDDYFDAEKYPKITFESKKWEKIGDNQFEVTGDLDMRGHSKEVTLDVTLLGIGHNPRGGTISGWLAETTLDRTKFDIKSGTPVVGTSVEVKIAIEAGSK